MASGMMTIRYGSEQIASKAGRAIGDLNGITKDLGSVRKKIGSLPERSRWGDNLSKSSAFLRKKMQQYERHTDALETLKKRSDAFMSKVETTEKKLSDQIKHEYKQFNQQTGIGKTRVAYLMDMIKKGFENVKKFFTETIPYFGKLVKEAFERGVKTVKEAITDWLKKHGEGLLLIGKALLATVVLIASIAATIFAIAGMILAAPTGIGAVAFAALAAASIMGTFDALFSAGKAWDAVGKYYSGDKAKAREIDSQSTGEYLFGPDSFWSGVYDTSMIIASLVNIVSALATGNFGIFDDVGKFFSAFKDGKIVQDAVKGFFALLNVIAKAPGILESFFKGEAAQGIIDLIESFA